MGKARRDAFREWGRGRAAGSLWIAQVSEQAPRMVGFFFPLVTPFCPMDVTFSSCSFLSPSFWGEASLGRWVGAFFFSHEPSELQFTNYSVN